MNLVLFKHPDFARIRSQTFFADWLARAYELRGHAVEVRTCEPQLRKHVRPGRWAKWAGYIDQYLLFPAELRDGLDRDPAGTLYVFCDQALGPWMPNVTRRPHVVHCHDLLALRSALGDIAEHRTSMTGRMYQRYIRHGFRHARHFISISKRTRDDLQRFGQVSPLTSEVVYNGLHHPFVPVAPDSAGTALRARGLPADARRCILHVGGGQWYKNTLGVVRLYAAYANLAQRAGRIPAPLWVVGPDPDEAVRKALMQLQPSAEVRFFHDVDHETLGSLYGFAEVLLFPSLAEGFGWPIVEALASGCPVITTGEPPMTEVGGPCALYLPRLSLDEDLAAWAELGGAMLAALLERGPAQRAAAAAAAIAWSRRFNAECAIDSYLEIYQRVLALGSDERM